MSQQYYALEVEIYMPRVISLEEKTIEDYIVMKRKSLENALRKEGMMIKHITLRRAMIPDPSLIDITEQLPRKQRRE